MAQTSVFVINLDRSKDRLQHVATEVAACGLDWDRVAAIYGTPAALNFVNQAAFRRRHHAALRLGEVGCYLSHYKALGAFLDTGAPRGLILEDDVVLHPGLPSVLHALEDCADEWDLVKLHATHPGGVIERRQLVGSYRLVSLAFRHGSAAAYLVNRLAAQRLRDGMLPMTVPYDHEFDRAWKYGIKLRSVMPFPVKRRKMPSTITASAQADPSERVNARRWRPWYKQGGMVLFRGANDVARVVHELGQSRASGR